MVARFKPHVNTARLLSRASGSVTGPPTSTEYSARYSILDREFYIPDPPMVNAQSVGE